MERTTKPKLLMALGRFFGSKDQVVLEGDLYDMAFRIEQTVSEASDIERTDSEASDKAYSSRYFDEDAFRPKLERETQKRVQESKISILFDPGETNKDQLVDFLLFLSELYRSVGGDGLVITDSGGVEFRRGEVTS